MNIKKMPTSINGIEKSKNNTLNKMGPAFVSFREVIKNIINPFQDAVKIRRAIFPVKDLDAVGFKVCIISIIINHHECDLSLW